MKRHDIEFPINSFADFGLDNFERKESIAGNSTYPQVGFQCFVDRIPHVRDEKQYFAGSSSVNSRPAYLCEMLETSLKD